MTCLIVLQHRLWPAMPPSSPVPKNWPGNIQYLATPEYSKSLNPVHRSAIQTQTNEAQKAALTVTKGPCQLVKITPINAASHPAFGQSGLFAAKDLKPGTFVLQYRGEIHAALMNDASDPHAQSDYDLGLDREHGIGIDAARKGNEARFINDYRGIAEKPNAEFKELWDEVRKERGIGIWVLGPGKKSKVRGIRKGEEILVSYGRGFWGARKTNDEVFITCS